MAEINWLNIAMQGALSYEKHENTMADDALCIRVDRPSAVIIFPLRKVRLRMASMGSGSPNYPSQLKSCLREIWK